MPGSRSIQADITSVLSDGKWHTMSEIADEIEVCRMTVQKHIAAIAYRNPSIEIFCGGIKRGGVRMVIDHSLGNRKVSVDELQIVIKALEHFSTTGADVKGLIAKLSRS